MCSCDPGYHGDMCLPDQSLPSYLKEGFLLADGLDEHPEVIPLLDTFVSCEFKIFSESFSKIVYKHLSLIIFEIKMWLRSKWVKI